MHNTKSLPLNRSRAGRSSSGGFTLIELVFTVVILGVLLALGVPSFIDMVRDQRVKTVVGDIYASIIYARSEAITRNNNVVICTSGDWAVNGWSVRTPDCTGTVLKQQDAIASINITQANGNAVGDVTYKRDGRLASSVPEMVVRSSESASITARCLSIDLGGRPSIKVDTDKNPSNGC